MIVTVRTPSGNIVHVDLIQAPTGEFIRPANGFPNLEAFQAWQFAQSPQTSGLIQLGYSIANLANLQARGTSDY